MPSNRVIKIAPGEDGHAWADALSDPAWRESAEPLKRDAGVSVWRTRMLGRDVVVKCWSLRRFRRRLQVFVRATPGVRQWRGAAWLMKHGFPTAPTYALVRLTLDGGPCDCLVMKMLPGKSVLEHLKLADLNAVEEHTLARVLGEQIGAMIDLGRFNRDHKPSNLIIAPDEEHGFRVSIIDAVAIRRVSRTWDGLCDMLADLLIEPTGCGCPPRRSLMLRTALAAIGIDDATRRSKRPGVKREIRDAWLWVQSEVDLRGDPTPKVNPLANVRRTDG